MNKKLRILLVVLLTVVLVFGFVACGENDKKTLTIDKTDISLVGIGATEQITAKLDDKVALDGITWTSITSPFSGTVEIRDVAFGTLAGKKIWLAIGDKVAAISSME